MKLIDLLSDPSGFFEKTREENWRPAFVFFLKITLALSIATTVVNYLGIESTDFSSAYQAQIMVYRLMKTTLLPQYGDLAYLIEPFLILGISVVVLFALTALLHVIFRLIGGKGSVLNAWKAASYGTGPCILGGFLPYVSLFAAFYSLMIQFYFGPKVLYRAKESLALLFIATIVALAFIEMFLTGTTVGFP